MKTIQELNDIRKQMRAELNLDGKTNSNIRVTVGLATCGIAAGAEPVFKAFQKEVKRLGLTNVKIIQSGCLGMCKHEPMVEVTEAGKEKVTYIALAADSAKRIAEEHLAGGKPVMDFVIGNE
ncbi:MAG: (2Fe-2S) ferredoxin domain-containing protein [Firmicutes bacterium]|nr:(2Fe-2S) ferredoxin domain-containing protein [Bacillota bacterium]